MLIICTYRLRTSLTSPLADPDQGLRSMTKSTTGKPSLCRHLRFSVRCKCNYRTLARNHAFSYQPSNAALAALAATDLLERQLKRTLHIRCTPLGCCRSSTANSDSSQTGPAGRRSAYITGDAISRQKNRCKALQ